MKAQAFLTLVGQMMTAQQDYFKARTQTALIAAKSIEKQVVAVVKEGRLEPDQLDFIIDQPKTQLELDLLGKDWGTELDLPDIQRPTDTKKGD